MDTMIGLPTDSVLDQFEDLTSGGETRACRGGKSGGVVRRSTLTSRDIEAEILAKLARRGYDWTGSLYEEGHHEWPGE
jgi:hypothetical protein